MGIGAGIFLIALGAILTFAVNWHVHGLDLHAVGWVLMIAGVAGIILYFVFWNNRRRPGAVVTQRRTNVSDPYGPADSYQESVTYRDQAPPPPPGV
ncbi:MAG TPA: DUF6458 family protein [Micromonosporaceae bacterium]|jgi:hypothetical protein